MNFLIIITTQTEKNLEEFHKLIGDYDASIRANTNTWLINTNYEIHIIRQHLTNMISIHDSVLIFRIENEHSFTNHLDVSEWIEDIKETGLERAS